MFDDITTQALTAALRGGMARQQAIAQNLANADTPGYKGLSVEFEGALARAIDSDRARIADNLSQGNDAEQWWDRRDGATGFRESMGMTGRVMPASSRSPELTERVDGSNIDPDQQMADLAANQIAYNTSNELLRTRFGQFRAVISGQ